jgi:hypothetical protein
MQQQQQQQPSSSNNKQRSFPQTSSRPLNFRRRYLVCWEKNLIKSQLTIANNEFFSKKISDYICFFFE